MVDLAPAPALLAIPRRSRRGRRIAAALVVVVALIGGLWWFAQWRSSLHVLVDYPTVGTRVPAGAVGQSVYFGNNVIAQQVIDRPDEPSPVTLDVDSARPVVRENTADARISVMSCVLAADGGGPLGDRSAEVGRTCATLVPFRAGTLRLGALKGQADLVIVATPRRPGKVIIDGLDISYSSGLRDGAQHVGGQIELDTKAR